MSNFIEALLRENIRKMIPYSSARDDFKGNAKIYLDANESPYGALYNRYPDPYQLKLKNRIREIKNININNIFIGNGSDEIIDLLIRAFCNPGQDSILSLNPSYGMYKVCASVNDVELKLYNLDTNFDLNVEELISKLAYSKILFLCSPNNPSGNDFDENEVIQIIKSYNGIVVIDEAYKDFSSKRSLISEISRYDNLVILQTLSKAYGMASLRLGIAYASEYIIQILNKIKPPYNINKASQDIALEYLSDVELVENQIIEIKKERERLYQELKSNNRILKVFESQANFLLFKVKDANHFYNYFIEHGIVLRNRHGQHNCDNCIRITIGTKNENDKFLELLNFYND